MLAKIESKVDLERKDLIRLIECDISKNSCVKSGNLESIVELGSAYYCIKWKYVSSDTTKNVYNSQPYKVVKKERVAIITEWVRVK